MTTIRTGRLSGVKVDDAKTNLPAESQGQGPQVRYSACFMFYPFDCDTEYYLILFDNHAQLSFDGRTL